MADKITKLATKILDGLVKIKEHDGPLTDKDRANLKRARALIRKAKKK